MHVCLTIVVDEIDKCFKQKLTTKFVYASVLDKSDN